MRTILLKNAMLVGLLAGVCLPAVTCNVPGLDGAYYRSWDGYTEDVWYEDTYYTYDDYYYDDYCCDDGWGFDLWLDDWW